MVTTGGEKEGKGDLLCNGHRVSVGDSQNLPEMVVDKSIPEILSHVLYVAHQKGDKCRCVDRLRWQCATEAEENAQNSRIHEKK